MKKKDDFIDYKLRLHKIVFWTFVIITFILFFYSNKVHSDRITAIESTLSGYEEGCVEENVERNFNLIFQ